jgi:hypothetical protein
MHFTELFNNVQKQHEMYRGKSYAPKWLFDNERIARGAYLGQVCYCSKTELCVAGTEGYTIAAI